MLSTYNRKDMAKLGTVEAQSVLYNALYPVQLSGLEWNQYIGKIIINDFIKQLPQYDGTDFTAYIKDVVPFIQLGLFQSAIGIINGIDIPGLAKIKTWLLKSLAEGEDRDEYKQDIN